MRDEALAHLEVQVPRVNNLCRHQDFILNMDQTPVYQAMDEGRTIDVVGVRTVNLRTSANDSQRITTTKGLLCIVLSYYGLFFCMINK